MELERLSQSRKRHILFVAIAFSNIAGRCTSLPTAAVEDNLLRIFGLWETELLLELLGVQLEGFGQNAERDVNRGRNRALGNLIRLPNVDEECVLLQIKRSESGVTSEKLNRHTAVGFWALGRTSSYEMTFASQSLWRRSFSLYAFFLASSDGDLLDCVELNRTELARTGLRVVVAM